MRANDSARSVKAQKKICGRLDYIIDIYESVGFVDITGKIGGDIITYRVYDNGNVTER
ncbi:MAG: hypothetical protein K6G24_12180 [Lachnospiraceae bacterium]|nr:hypothetical protein [Lachnospiraceae bacterium]